MTNADAALAARLADEAGGLLLALRESWSAGASRADLRHAADRAAHEFLVEALSAERPSDAVLSEEGADDPSRLTAERVWIVDPLDGTREFAEHRSDWAVHVALWQRDQRHGRLMAGAVALPGEKTTLCSDTATLAPRVTPPGAASPPPWRIAVSRTRAPAVAERAANALGAELVPMGSAGYKVSSVIRGKTDAYVHAGGQYEWDSAAPVAAAAAAGLHVSRLDGSPLRYNNVNPYLPDLLVARPELAAVLVAACSEDPPDPVTAALRSTP
ncbi:3'(2'),5'-bisphosphate nucleotidase CysQ [Phytoactinopolyspora mesophila]|uniref:3'(2'),5'-bisphosphate nucleotidase CysQ n=1 Tax=Phytoactinopolyspora mesophila TaxID=2650750 RepID=A0A7K3M5I5_9ACTN|nr:3'(2'),5'-bisphosphate nucleotidase CysQ [Phytoactinopolyspora mesophila]NDL58496.1 3'(2'),5'-bisphosphate nucleotidase CysQ [Phytoactinopolyspora mesophila]